MLIYISIAIVLVSGYFGVKDKPKVDATMLHGLCFAGAFSACGLFGMACDIPNHELALNLGWILAGLSVIYGLWKARGNGAKTYAHQENSRVHRRHF